MKTIIRKLAGTVILLALLIAFLAVISVPPEERAQVGLLDEVQETVKELERFDAGDSTLENERYKLSLNGEFGSVVIMDKATGTQWSSFPEEATGKLPANNRRYSRSPVFVKYSEGKETVQTYPFKEQATLSVTEEEDALRLDYNMTNLDIAFSLVIQLREDGFEVTIPFESVREGSQYKLISIEPFPFFDAGGEEENGALVVPDGSGALIGFTDQHPKYFQPYSQYIYGGDHAFQSKVLENVAQLPHENISPWQQERAALPIFGLYRDSRSYLGIVTQGDHDAKINATPSGIRNIKLYRIAAEFVYRNDDFVFLGGRGKVPLLQSRFISGDRQVRYVLLNRDKPGYVGMAAAFRDYLIAEKGLTPVESEPVPYQLRLFGGVKQNEVIGKSFVPMTTFEQAKVIIDELMTQGIGSIEVTYDGWSSGGIYGDQPKHLPASSSLGGSKELGKLADYAREKGIKLYLKTNYVRVASGSKGWKKSREAVRGLNKELLKSYDARRATRQPRGSGFYLVRSDLVTNHLDREAAAYEKLGVHGIQFGHMGDMLYSDPGSDKPLFRQDAIQAWTEAMNWSRESLGDAAVDYGFGYTLGHVSRIDDIPLDYSGFLYEEQAIPFYQIAVHGLVGYTSSPLNLSDDPEAALLRAVEYGAMPSFYLTYEESYKLERAPVDDLVSTYYKDWIGPSADMYTRAVEVLGRVQHLTILGHERIDNKLYRTIYSDNTQIIVNYGDETRSVEGASIPAKGFKLVEGKGGNG